MATRSELRRQKTSSAGHRRRERLLARWRLSTILAAVVALAAVGAVLATALSLGGFGVPTDAFPQAINPSAVPFGLLSHSSPPTSPTTAAGHKPPKLENPVLLWFVGPNGHLVPVAAQTTPPVLLESVLTRLLAGPGALPAGSPADLQTAIPAGTVVLSAKVSDGLATIDLSPDIENASGEPLIQAFAQLVFTSATATTCPSTTKSVKVKALPKSAPTTAPRSGSATLPCADRVLFEVDGQPQQVPTSTGAQTSKPLTVSDYSSIF
ncbi:MAG: GerMN domain-containing protein [Acidimicrobiales bacterium]